MIANCVKTLFNREVLCAGTMDDFITIYNRELQGTSLDGEQAKPQFTEVSTAMGKLEARNPTQRFDGIVINNAITHAVYIPFTQQIYELDRNTLFVEYESTRNRWFKLLSIMNLGEQDEYLALMVKETGFVGLEASEG
jgi:hypothetical protein